MSATRQQELLPPHDAEVGAPQRPVWVFGAGAVLLLLGAVVVLAAGWHLTQGTSGVGFRDLVGLLAGEETIPVATRDILLGSRLPRLAAGLTVGFALGVAGALLQSIARNALASPDTLAVTGGAYFAVTLVAAFGLSVPLWASGAVAFAGGIAAAAIVAWGWQRFRVEPVEFREVDELPPTGRGEGGFGSTG